MEKKRNKLRETEKKKRYATTSWVMLKKRNKVNYNFILVVYQN